MLNQTSMKQRMQSFLLKFRFSDIVFVVSLSKVRVHAIRRMVECASTTLEKLCQGRDEKGEVLVPNISDPDSFCLLMALVHTFESVTIPIEGKPRRR